MTTRSVTPVEDEYGGFVLAFEPRRTETVARSIEAFGEASESFSWADWALEPREVAFLTLLPQEVGISAVVLMERMHGTGGTGKRMMRLRDPLLLEPPIEPDELARHIDPTDLVSTAERLKRLNHEKWLKLVELVKELRPASAPALDTLLAKREEDRRLFGDDARTRRLVEQRDALGLVLDIAHFDRKSVLGSVDPSRTPDARSILDLLDAEPMHEQDLIRKDERVFESLLRRSMRSARLSASGSPDVRVYVSDKKRLETVTGVDVLIYQAAYNSFLLLQYKTMSRANTAESWYYSVDDRLRAQIAAMNKLESAFLQQPLRHSGVWDWRLESSPFYFKFCETTRPSARDDSLVRGITLSLRHLKHFLTLPDCSGPRGGRRVGYDNCPRYLNNTQFVDLAREGWIGCDQSAIGTIAKVIDADIRGGKAAMLAAIDGVPSPSASDRGRRSRSYGDVRVSRT